MKKIAIMQPYLFPYIGYFQLIKEVDQFIIYDDVQFIKGGWINRNKLLINGDAKYFTVPCKGASPNKLINNVEHALDDKKRKKLLRKVEFAYRKAPFFKQVYPIVTRVIKADTNFVADLAAQSIKESCSYLNVDCNFKLSSEEYDNSKLDAADRIIDICRQEDISNYVNPIGGKDLYSKKYFKEEEINLQFLKSMGYEYGQWGGSFVPWLSIIDVMMFNSPTKINEKLLKAYKLL